MSLQNPRILILRLSSIGDILLTTPFVQQVRKAFPKGNITYIVKKEFSELLKFNPHIDELEPAVLLTGIHHAKELLGAEVCLYLLQYFCENYYNSDLKRPVAKIQAKNRNEYIKTFLIKMSKTIDIEFLTKSLYQE